MEKKPDFAMLIAKGLDKKDGSEPPADLPEEDMEMEDDTEGMQDSAVADLLSAFHSKNIPLAKQALKDFIALCDDEGYEEPEEPLMEE